MSSAKWRSLPCAVGDLNLDILGLGQSFRWRKIEHVWQGVMANRVWQLKRNEIEDRLYYRVLGKFSRCQSISGDQSDESILRDYFQLDLVPSLRRLYSEWSLADPYFSSISDRTPGIRVLRQHPSECLFSFICSTNNNIKRIGSMVETLCRLYGESINIDWTKIDGDQSNREGVIGDQKDDQSIIDQNDHSITDQTDRKSTIDHSDHQSIFYDFPTINRLSQDDVEATLRTNGFGYRAKFVAQTAKMLLKEIDREEIDIDQKLIDFRRSIIDSKTAKEFLMRFPGVGPKVADCVCLMSLDKTDAVPIDTHVRQITEDMYMPNLAKKSKTLTTKMYDEIGDFYRKLFGGYAGWAHSVLFSAKVAGKGK